MACLRPSCRPLELDRPHSAALSRPARVSLVAKLPRPARRLVALGLLLFAAVSSACSKPAEIRRYQVEKPPHRMLAAIVTREKDAWFFKLTGPRVEVAELADEFRAFLESLRFAEGADAKPEWDLPSGWTLQPGNEQRFATIEIPSEPKPVELSVTRLPVPPMVPADSYQLQNINRWRQQMRLGIILSDQLAEESQGLTTKSGVAVTWVNYVGTMAEPSRGPREMMGRDGMGMEAPFAGGPGVPPGGAPGAGGSAPSAPLPFTHEAPAEWQVLPTSNFRRLAFQVGSKSDGTAAEITVINLPAEANDLLANVNRWRGQCELPPWTSEQLAQSAKTVEMGSVQGTYVELAAEKPAGGDKVVLGVIAVHETQAWFFKMIGPRQSVMSEKPRFESFIKSVKFSR